MKTYHVLAVCLAVCALFGVALGSTNDDCGKVSNSDCQTCQKVDGCAFCKRDKTCFLHNFNGLVNTNCSSSDIQFQTCVGNLKVWAIIVGVIVGIVVIAIAITIFCLCRKCKKRRIRREDRRQERNEQQMAERHAAADVRTAERNQIAEQLRMKYGILKANDAGTDYTRMS